MYFFIVAKGYSAVNEGGLLHRIKYFRYKIELKESGDFKVSCFQLGIQKDEDAIGVFERIRIAFHKGQNETKIDSLTSLLNCLGFPADRSFLGSFFVPHPILPDLQYLTGT